MSTPSDQSNSRLRVKVYQLNDLGQWDDQGTGHVRYEQKDNEFILSVQSEITNQDLVVHRVDVQIDYQRQGETIITWSDVDTGHDLALSFQESQGCEEVWEHITASQNRDAEPFPTEETAEVCSFVRLFVCSFVRLCAVLLMFL